MRSFAQLLTHSALYQFFNWDSFELRIDFGSNRDLKNQNLIVRHRKIHIASVNCPSIITVTLLHVVIGGLLNTQTQRHTQTAGVTYRPTIFY